MTHSGPSPVEPLGEVKAVSDGSAQMLTTLTTLRETLKHARLPLEVRTRHTGIYPRELAHRKVKRKTYRG